MTHKVRKFFFYLKKITNTDDNLNAQYNFQTKHSYPDMKYRF